MAQLTDAAIAEIVAHMNDDHGDAIAAYARRFGGIDDARAASIVAMDATCMTVVASGATGDRTVRIPFDHELRDTDDARATLIAMARSQS